MRHLKIFGLCLIAALGLAAAVASAAQAEGPEWGRCLHIEPEKGKEIKKGNYADPNCQKVAEVEKHGKKVPSHKGAYEWYGGAKQYCQKQKAATFKYKNNTCTEVAEKKGVPDNKGKYELGPGTKFTAEGGAGVLGTEDYECYKGGSGPETIGPRESCHEEYDWNLSNVEVECTSEHATGEAAGTDEVANVSVRFKGCTQGGAPVQTHGLPAGEIQVKTLKGHLGYINKAATPQPEVGVLLEPAEKGGLFAEFEAASGDLEMRVGAGNPEQGSFYEEVGTPGVPNGNDAIISPITPINTMTPKFTQDYRAQVIPYECKAKTCNREAAQLADDDAHQNVPTHFEGGPLDALEVYGENPSNCYGEPGEFECAKWAWSPASEEITNVNTVEGEAEIKA